MKQQTKTKIANALVYTFTVGMLLAAVAVVVVLAILSWQALLVLLVVIGLVSLFGWMAKHETVSNEQN